MICLFLIVDERRLNIILPVRMHIDTLLVYLCAFMYILSKVYYFTASSFWCSLENYYFALRLRGQAKAKRHISLSDLRNHATILTLPWGQ